MEKLLLAAKQYFPNLKIKYKDESIFMKFLSKILFFNKDFMSKYTTTIGSTIYFPNKKIVEAEGYTATLIFLHELIHVYDSQRFNQILFSFLYLTPQILALLLVPLFFINWKLACILFIIFLLPLPSFFRMYFEKRAYFISLYVLNYLIKYKKIQADLNQSKKYYLSNFKDSSYYFMWTFKQLDKDFSEAVNKIKNDQKPFDDRIFNIIDNLLKQI